jgi:ribonuclease VapC
VSLAEVTTKLTEVGLTKDALRAVLEVLNLKIISFEKEDAYETGLLRTASKPLGLSLGDRACLVLGKPL